LALDEGLLQYLAVPKAEEQMASHYPGIRHAVEDESLDGAPTNCGELAGDRWGGTK
jgi:hypothetical protein